MGGHEAVRLARMDEEPAIGNQFGGRLPHWSARRRAAWAETVKPIEFHPPA